MPVQSLVRLMKSILKTGPVTSEHLPSLCNIIEKINRQDLALPPPEEERAAQIEYIELHNGSDYTLCLFLLPKGAVLPLHNHPDMHVISKVLYGTLHIKSLSPRGKIRSDTNNNGCDAVVEGDKDLCEGNLSVLTPSSGNVHELVAKSRCALLDLLTPPYNHGSGRICTFFSEAQEPSAGKSPNGVKSVALQQIPVPDSFYTVRRPYLGPPINDQ